MVIFLVRAIFIFRKERQSQNFESKKIITKNSHGTGCTLSSAIACGLGQQLSLKESINRAHKYVYKSILNAPNIGKGNGPLNHLIKV